MAVLWVFCAAIGLLSAILSVVGIGRSNYYLKQDLAILTSGVILFTGSALQLTGLL